MSSLREAIGVGLILGAVHGFLASPADAYTTPTFTTGTVNSHTESKTTVTETIHQIDYTTGWTYSVSGTNITIPGNPAPGAGYSMTLPGDPFQFSESYFPAGMVGETFVERTTVTESVTDSLSVFTQ